MNKVNESEDSRVAHKLLDWVFQRMLTTLIVFTSSQISASLHRLLCSFASLEDNSTAPEAPLLTCTDNWKCLGIYVCSVQPQDGF